MRMRMQPGHRLAAVFSPARRFGHVRPPMIGGLVVALALVGVIVWLAIAGGGGETEGTQLNIPLGEAPEETAGHEAPHEGTASEPSRSAAHDGAGEAAKDAGHGATAPPATAEPPSSSVGEAPPTPAPDAVDDVIAMAFKVDNGTPLGEIDPVLLQPSGHGPLPIIGPDERRPWQVYARPFEAEGARRGSPSW